MNKIIISIICLILLGCNPESESESELSRAVKYLQNDYEIVTIDGCEYIFYSSTRKGMITHKGNCKYCVERNKKAAQK